MEKDGGFFKDVKGGLVSNKNVPTIILKSLVSKGKGVRERKTCNYIYSESPFTNKAASKKSYICG